MTRYAPCSFWGGDSGDVVTWFSIRLKRRKKKSWARGPSLYLHLVLLPRPVAPRDLMLDPKTHCYSELGAPIHNTQCVNFRGRRGACILYSIYTEAGLMGWEFGFLKGWIFTVIYAVVHPLSQEAFVRKSEGVTGRLWCPAVSGTRAGSSCVSYHGFDHVWANLCMDMKNGISYPNQDNSYCYVGLPWTLASCFIVPSMDPRAKIYYIIIGYFYLVSSLLILGSVIVVVTSKFVAASWIVE